MSYSTLSDCLLSFSFPYLLIFGWFNLFSPSYYVYLCLSSAFHIPHKYLFKHSFRLFFQNVLKFLSYKVLNILYYFNHLFSRFSLSSTTWDTSSLPSYHLLYLLSPPRQLIFFLLSSQFISIPLFLLSSQFISIPLFLLSSQFISIPLSISYV